MRWLLLFAGILSGCGDDQPPTGFDDAAAAEDAASDTALDTAPPDMLEPDAAVCSTFVASTSTSTTDVTYAFSGGAFQSFGCAPIDPTYWMVGSGTSVTMSFASPQSMPSIRVWGMNTDDTASIAVDGAPYALDATTATLSPKVVCGTSPGPDGVTFAGGLLAGANTPVQGNFSYQDVTLLRASVTTIRIESLTGAGWGFAGTSLTAACPTN